MGEQVSLEHSVNCSKCQITENPFYVPTLCIYYAPCVHVYVHTYICLDLYVYTYIQGNLL